MCGISFCSREAFFETGYTVTKFATVMDRRIKKKTERIRTLEFLNNKLHLNEINIGKCTVRYKCFTLFLAESRHRQTENINIK